MNFFCKHEWEIKSKDILPSAYEQYKDQKIYPDGVYTTHFQKKLILVMVCKKCGKINKTIETNP